MRNILSILLILYILATAETAWGAAIPQASRYDARMQQVIYNPQNVTVVNTRAGFMTTLVFDSDEAVLSARPGFEEAWEATPDANRVSVRPVALVQGAPGEDGNTTQVVIPPNGRDWRTNLFVVTNRRFYNLELNVTDDTSAQPSAFQVTFRYPDDARNKAQNNAASRLAQWQRQQERMAVQKTLSAAQRPRNWNFLKYPGRGSDGITPDFAFDDGRFTFLGFSPHKRIPSVFRWNDGQEQTTNTGIQKQGSFTVLVIQEITPRLVLRSGHTVVGVENRSAGHIRPPDGTTVSPQVERVEKTVPDRQEGHP
ncbi:P-type conjugative transfer protein VirB9 [Citrobacter amalonaticus]|uniref:P-type conjugative transfer protein VirB9 n=1 Tax=Citrobacter amalonaticus TaxID=35703 RepID=UPI001A1804E4|nr:P-type conjugative transfer protein VirB9 [Citrobacter amalonaticus]HDQ2811397.1 P-type conjugative transfer protein VirB9 [Citrobacter amalonaticus]